MAILAKHRIYVRRDASVSKPVLIFPIPYTEDSEDLEIELAEAIGCLEITVKGTLSAGATHFTAEEVTKTWLLDYKGE